MTPVFHAKTDGRFIEVEIKRNLRRKQLHRKSQGSIFLEVVLAIEKI